MSAFKQSMRKFGVRAGLLAGTSAAVLAIAGIGAGSAVAAECPNNSELAAEGSSLQKIAQTEVWTPAYNTACANAPKVTYTSSSSGAGLTAMGFNGSVLKTTIQFIGTDDAPNSTQIGNAQTAVSNKTKPVIVPVSQTAIAVVIHPPAGCSFAAGTGITWLDLNKVFGGKELTNWNQFTNITGGASCNQAITRVVRSDGSGTSYQIKNYLSVLETEKSAETLPCAVEGHTKWGELREVGAENKPNISWPECSGGSPVVKVSGGGGVAETVAKAENIGYIGYASLPDAKAKGAQVAMLQNGVVGTPTYAEAGEKTGEAGGKELGVARCTTARYTVPAKGRSTSGEAEAGIAVDWSTVFGAQPEAGGENYPLCTLTYDAGWHEYKQIPAFSEAIGKAVKAYFGYETTAAEGQSALATAGKWYSKLPTLGKAGSATNVQDAAVFAAGKIG